MNKQTAIKVLETTNKCSNELGKLIPYLKSNCEDEAEYEILAKNLAKVMANIYYAIDSQIYDKYPELKPNQA